MKPIPSSAHKSGVYWTQFPASALSGADGAQVDWSDHRAAHRAVSRLFAPRLPGAAEERRAAAGILYRVDLVRPGDPAVVLVQSLVPPELTPALSRTTEVSLRAWAFEPGDRVAVRVAVNPVRRTTRHFADAAKSTMSPESNLAGRDVERDASGRRSRGPVKQTAVVVPVAEIEPWLLGKLGDTLTGVEILNHFRDKLCSGAQALVVDTFDLVAEVADANALDALRLAGVGRGKAYGCGLITARRIAP